VNPLIVPQALFERFQRVTYRAMTGPGLPEGQSEWFTPQWISNAFQPQPDGWSRLSHPDALALSKRDILLGTERRAVWRGRTGPVTLARSHLAYLHIEKTCFRVEAN
jgi:hypothetical protein